MPTEGKRYSTDAGGRRYWRRWFAHNRNSVGYHPQAWQGWLIMGLAVAVIVTLVVLFRQGLL